MNVLGAFHTKYIFSQRISRIANLVSPRLGSGESVLDIGAGSGELAQMILTQRSDLTIRGVDVVPRSHTAIPVSIFDGRDLPFPDGAFDSAILIDVLHHAENPKRLLEEALRVVRSKVIIKDHLREGIGAQLTLSAMDFVGNWRFNVALPCRYLSRQEWQDMLRAFGVSVFDWNERPRIYRQPWSLLFDRRLHVLFTMQK